jgi:hypothetical protein
MATILSLALKVNADASGVVKNLTPAERALENLAKQASKATSVFDEFATNSEAASAAQATLNDKFAALAEQLKGGLNAQAYADQYAALQDEVRNTADAFSEASKIIEENRTEEELRTETLARLSELVALGALDEEQYARAVAESSGANAAAAKAEEERLRLLERGRQITEQFLTDEERRARQLEELNQIVTANGISEEAAARARFEFSGLAAQLERDGLELKRQLAAEREADAAKEKASLEQIAAVEKRLAEDSAASQRLRAQETAKAATIIAAGRNAQQIFNDAIDEAIDLERKGLLTKKQFDVELERQNAILNKATAAADGFGKSVKKAAESGLKFNEISGILAALPGPLGNIAGRFSGLSSASEGLSRVFSGGLKTGLSSLGSQLSALATPLNLGIAAFASFGAAATAITRGLADLEGRVEQLGNAALRLGTDFETIQILDEAARRGGVSIDALADGIQKLAVNINKARVGTGNAADAFRELGITQEQLLRLDPATLAQETAAALQKIEDPARRAALATETLGKAALTLLPGFNAIGESETALRRFAALIPEVDRDRISSLGQAFDNVKTAILGLGQNILLPFSGVVEGLANLFADVIGTVNRFAQVIGFVLKPVLDAMGRGFAAFGDAIKFAFEGFDLFTRGIKVADGNAKLFRAEVEADAKAIEELKRAIENGNKALDIAIDKSADFGKEGFNAALKFQQALRELADVAKEENYNGEQYAQAVANATAEYERQIVAIKKVTEKTKEAADEAKKKAEADKKRIEELLNPDDAADKLQLDIAYAIKKQAEAQRALTAARAAEEKESANAAASRLAQLDQLRTKLENQQAAINQGFANGFNEAFTSTAENLKELTDKASGFGNAGIKAAFEFQQRVSLLQEQARAGVFTEPSYNAEVERERKLFEKRLEQIDILRQREKQAKDDVFNAQVLATERVNQFIASKLTEQQNAEIANAGQAATRRQQAALNIAAIQQRIALDFQVLEAAREQNDAKAAKAAVQRIEFLDNALKIEQKIADGRGQQLQAQQQLIESQQQYDKQQQAAVQAYQQQQQQAQQAYAQEQARIFEEQRKAAEAEAKRQEERIRKLNTLGAQSVSVADIRNTESANLVLQLGAAAQDPALIQQRLQTKLLEKIALGIGQASSNYFNQPVAIVGYADVGGI